MAEKHKEEIRKELITAKAGVESEKLQSEGYSVIEIINDPATGFKMHTLTKIK